MTQQEIDVSAPRPFAIITGASTGIGSELAKRCAKEGYDLSDRGGRTRDREGGDLDPKRWRDLATTEGVDKLYAAAKGRQVDALLANAGRGFRKGAAGHGYQHHRHRLSDPQDWQ